MGILDFMSPSKASKPEDEDHDDAKSVEDDQIKRIVHCSFTIGDGKQVHNIVLPDRKEPTNTLSLADVLEDAPVHSLTASLPVVASIEGSAETL